MTNLYNDYGVKFVPFRLRTENAASARSWIGGEPPAGVFPPQVHRRTRHLATLGLEEELDVSMFGTFDPDGPPGPFDLFSRTRKLQDASSPLIQFVVHPARLLKSTGSSLRSEIPALSLLFGTAGNDRRCNTTADLGLANIYPTHKVGGMPFFDQLEGDVGDALALLDCGFVHLLQLSSLGKLDSIVPGNWFFGETTLHVFARKERGTFNFRYIWG